MIVEHRKAVRVQIVELPSHWALGILNPNAFEPTLRDFAHETAHQLATCAAASLEVRKSVPRPEQLLSGFTLEDGKDVTSSPDKPLVIVYEAISFVGTLYGMLVAAKSTLDSFAKLVTKTLAPAESLGGFNKARIANKGEVAGGRLLNWLTTHSTRNSQVGPICTKLLQLFQDHVDLWIDTAVLWRDDAVHHGGIKNMIPMQASVRTTVRALNVKDVVGPLMPDRTPVAEFAAKLITNLTILIDASVRILPGVDVALLSTPSVSDLVLRRPPVGPMPWQDNWVATQTPPRKRTRRKRYQRGCTFRWPAP